MTLRRLILERVVATIPVLLGVTVITFAIAHSVAGDPARALAGPYADRTTIENIRHEWGLDKSVTTQYWIYLKRLAHGDLGDSIQTRNSVLSDIASRLPATLELTFFALFLMCVLGIGLGTAAAAWRNRFPDYLGRLVAVGGGAIPTFWLALVLQLVFFRELAWLPASGRLDVLTTPPQHVTGFYVVDSLIAGDWSALSDSLKHLILPGVTLALVGIAGVTRMTRSSLIEVLQQDYVLAARARGLRGRTVVLGHALPNALIPTVTVIGLLFGAMIGGALVIEWIFGWPGVGSYAATSITNLDYTAIMGAALVISVIYLIANLLVDLAYMLLDPRVREG